MQPTFSVLYFGYGELAQPAVDSLLAAGVRLAGVVAPSNRAGPDVEAVRILAEERGLPLLTQPPRKQIASFENEVRKLAPDLLVVWSYSMILPGSLLRLGRRGCVNVHGGLLPEYRGGHVMQWAIINGETETGVTLHHLDEGIDTGPIIAQSRFPITPQDDAASVRDKLKLHGAGLLRKWIVPVATGTTPRIIQDEAAGRYYRMRTPADGQIDWTQPAERIRNLVRALVPPWPGAFTWLNGRKIVVYEAHVLAQGRVPCPPGAICGSNGTAVHVACGDGVLALDRFIVADDDVEPRLGAQGNFRIGDVFGRTSMAA